MNKDNKDEREVDGIRLFGILLPKMPSLMFRLSGTLIRFKGQANKSGKVFKKELVKQGIDKETAEELKEIYMEGSHIRQYLINVR
jgi:hypothetical protein